MTSITQLGILLLIPSGINAQTVNEDYESTRGDILDDIILEDNTVGPVGIVNELHQAKNDLATIMKMQADGDYSTPDYPFVITYVDEEKGDLVVVMHAMAGLVGINYDEKEIQIAIGHDVPIEIMYGEFQLEVSQSRIERENVKSTLNLK